MKIGSRQALLSAFCLISCSTSAQRYVNEVFTDAQVTVSPDVPYGMNIDFMTSDLSDPAAFTEELFQLQYFVSNNIEIPWIFFEPEDPNTLLKLTEPRMDIYQPDQLIDCEEQRPLFIYLHTGDGLPPPLNGRPFGSRKDSCAVEICTRMARRGYVAVSLSYRPGWHADATDTDSLRGSWVNLLYRGVHDLRQGIRALKAAAPVYGLAVDKVIVCGEGMGAHIALAAATLDEPAELFIPSFLPDPSEPTISYIDTMMAGDLDGFNGLMTLYRPNGYNSDFQLCVSIDGALVDTSWLATSDVPIVSFHPVFDPYVPFTTGGIRTRIGIDPVIPVQGPELFQAAANALGVNSAFTGFPDGDPFTDRARELYGTTQMHTGASAAIGDQVEGLFPIVTPDWPAGDPNLDEEGHPWAWWDPQDSLAQVELSPGVTVSDAELTGNPDMSPEKGRAYLDTIIGYMNPRIIAVLDLSDELAFVGMPCDDADLNTINDVYTADCICLGIVDAIDESDLARGLRIGPSPSHDQMRITSETAMIRSYELRDARARCIRADMVNARQFTLDRAGLRAGSYLLIARFAEGTVTRKIVFD